MSLYNQFKTDKSLETEGVWIDYGNNSQGEPIRFLVARAGGRNTAFNKALQKATKPYRRAIQNDAMDEDVADRVYREVFVETVLKGWEGVEDEDGVAMPFSRGNAVKLFTDLPDLYADLRQQAMSMAIFKDEELEGDLGNSGA